MQTQTHSGCTRDWDINCLSAECPLCMHTHPMLPLCMRIYVVIKETDTLSKWYIQLQEFTWPAVFLEMVASSTFSGDRDVLSIVLLRICDRHQCKSYVDTWAHPPRHDANVPSAASKATNATNAPDSPPLPEPLMLHQCLAHALPKHSSSVVMTPIVMPHSRQAMSGVTQRRKKKIWNMQDLAFVTSLMASASVMSSL